MMISKAAVSDLWKSNYNGFCTLVSEETFITDLQMDGRLAERVINWTESLADRMFNTAPNSFPFFPIEQLTFERCRLFFGKKLESGPHRPKSPEILISKFFSRIPLHVWARLKEEKQINIFSGPLKDHVIGEVLCQEPMSKENAIDFLGTNSEFFFLLPDRFKTTAIIDEVSTHIHGLRIILYVPANLWSENLLIRALTENIVPKYIPSKFYDNLKIVKLLLEKDGYVPYEKLGPEIFESIVVRKVPVEFDSLARVRNFTKKWIEEIDDTDQEEEKEDSPRYSYRLSYLLFPDKNQRDFIDLYGEYAVKFLCQKKYRIRDETWKWIIETYPTMDMFRLFPYHLQTAELIEQMAFLEDFPNNIRHCDMRKMKTSTAALIVSRITDENYQSILEDILKNGGVYERTIPEGQVLLGIPWRVID